MAEKKGEDLSDERIVEAGSFMKAAVLALPTFGGKNMKMGMKVYPRAESLDDVDGSSLQR